MSKTAIAVAIASSIGSGTALAQERQLEEILVTAERRVSSEANTAISVEVLTDAFIAENQIKDIIDLQNAVPALQFFQNGSYVQANIRGVGNPSRGGPSEQVGVPVFFDGATQGEEMGIASGFFDVSGVEVLRGPQATFVGQAAAGGAILINSARPDFGGLSGFIEGTVGGYGQRKIVGALNLPVSDKVAARLAYMSEVRDSFFDNVVGSQVPGAGSQWTPGDQQDQNFRLSLLWEPTESFSLWTKLEQSELHSYGPTQQPNPNFYIGFWDDDSNPATPSLPVRTYAPHFDGPAPGTAPVNPATGGFLQGGVPGPGGAVYDPPSPWELANGLAQERDMKVDRVSVEANWTFESGITFRSLSSNIVMNRLQVEGGDSLAYGSLTGFQLGPGMRTWSQEFNLISPEGNKLEWLVGLYKNNRHTELHLNIPFGVGPVGGPVLNCGWQYDSSWTPCPTSLVPGLPRLLWNSVDDVIHQAVFAQLNFHVSDTVQLTLEARHNEDDNAQLRATYAGATTTPTTANAVPCHGNIEGQVYYCPPPGYPDLSTSNQFFVWKGDLPTYKLGVNWEPRDGHFLYAFFARGYKAGQSTAFTASPIVEEVVDDVEIGWKGTLRQGLYAEVGVYSMDYKDMQLAAFLTAGNEARSTVTNIGDSTIQGIEGSLRAVFGGFGIDVSAAYNDSELGEITTVDTRALPGLAVGGVYPGDISKGCNPATATVGSCFDYSPYAVTFTGAENPFSPKLTYRLGFDYAFQLSNGATLTPALSFNYADTTYTNTLQRPDDRYYRTDEREVLNFSVSFEKDDWDLQLFATNVSDEVYIEGHSNNGGAVFYGDPRVVGIRARMQF
jgi:iron complex outermembrane receptor protein